jgi:predicted nucleic acid-binding protein
MILDSTAWVEFFQNTEYAKFVVSAIEDTKSFTSVMTLAEISNWCCKNNQKEAIPRLIESVKNATKLLDVSENILITAGKLNYERKKGGKKWGMVDSIILATAQTYGLKILTKDYGFRDLPEAEML